MRKPPRRPSLAALLGRPGIRQLAVKPRGRGWRVRLLQLRRRGFPVAYFVLDGRKDWIFSISDFVSRREAVRVFEHGGAWMDLPADVLAVIETCGCGCGHADHCPSNTTTPPRAAS